MEPGRARRISARVLRVAALAWAILFTVVATMFAGGYALEDPGWPAGYLMVAAWLAPLGALTVVALRRPALAWRLMWACVGIAIAIALIQLAFPRVLTGWEFTNGPVVAIASFVPLVPLAILGRRRPLPAALAIAVIALGPVAVQLREEALHFGSSTAVSAPMLIAAALLALAGLLDRHPAP
jgi:hypothetical protein